MVAVHEFFSKQFSLLGFQIGLRPKVFLVVPSVIALVFTAGVFNLNYTNDVENFAIINGTTVRDRLLLNHHFPLNYSHKFSPSRMVYPGRYTRLILVGKDGGSILNRKSWSEIETLDKIIREVSVERDGVKGLNYAQLCGTWNGVCFDNEHLGVGDLIESIQNGSLRFSYPVMFNPISFQVYPLDEVFGGIKLRENSTNTVETISAMWLHYILRFETKEDDAVGLEWEYAVVERLKGLEDHWKEIKVYYDTYSTLATEGDKTLFGMLPYFIVSTGLMIVFAMSTSLTSDWVSSKPLVALMGVVSANMGALASVGILCLLGVDFAALNLGVPFIALGVGVDDTFVMLAAWWKTSRTDSVPQRMAHCYSEAAISITITTLTDAFSFYVGLLSPIPYIQIFCAYAGTAVLFIYIWHVFFFGGVLALSGYYEELGHHSLFVWRKVMSVAEAEHLSGITRWLLTDGDREQKSKISSEQKEMKINRVMDFFKNHFAPFLEKRIAQVAIIIFYLLYIGISIWGVSRMREGMQLYNLAMKDSYMNKFYQNYDKYFWNYPNRAQVMISGELDYSTKETQNRIANLFGNLTALKHMSADYTENWLRDYLRFLDVYKDFYDFNVTTEQDFIDTLRSHFLTDDRVYSQDVKFNENFTKIIATRYVIQLFNGSDGTSFLEDMIDHRKVTESFSDLKVIVFNPVYIFTDTGLMLKEMAVNLILIAGVIVMIVAVLFIPSVISSAFILLSLVSVELGVMGFLYFCGIELGISSVMTLLACVGFAVDFPAHVCYAYISSKHDTVEERIRETLYSLGLPILQGAISTILAISGLFFLTSHAPKVFYTIVCLIMTFSVFNALFVLPTLLLIVRPQPNQMFRKSKTYVVNK